MTLHCVSVLLSLPQGNPGARVRAPREATREWEKSGRRVEMKDCPLTWPSRQWTCGLLACLLTPFSFLSFFSLAHLLTCLLACSAASAKGASLALLARRSHSRPAWKLARATRSDSWGASRTFFQSASADSWARATLLLGRLGAESLRTSRPPFGGRPCSGLVRVRGALLCVLAN